MTDKKPYNSVDDVIALLDENKNQRGIDNWQKLSNKHELTSYGIGLTQLRKLAKKLAVTAHYRRYFGNLMCMTPK